MKCPEIAKNKLADFIDVFVKLDIFQWKKLNKLWKNSIWLKNQKFMSISLILLWNSGCKIQAPFSVDHLEIMKPEDIEALKNTETMPVALPSCSYFFGIPYTPAREMIAVGLH
jgi:imidazolonepropionase